MYDSRFYGQAALVVRCLPHLAKHDCFALKGGTAINLFIRDMPRISVDIDLAYVPLRPRDAALQEISDALNSLKADIEYNVQGASVSEQRAQGFAIKLSVVMGNAQIKVEPNLVLRGCLDKPLLREITAAAQHHFRASAKMKTLTDADLYGGKLCAALDRQHPRDLFDVFLLLKEEGITPAIRRAFVVYLASHTRPMHEILNPNLLDIAETFERQFAGMTSYPVSIHDLVEARHQLIRQLIPSIDAAERQFLLSMSSGDPDWGTLNIEHLQQLPALQWKLINVRKMDTRKRHEQCKLLKDILGER